MSNSNPKFSIIIPHYDGVISDEVLLRGLDCLQEQSFKDFEVRLYHDGPTIRQIPSLEKYSFPIYYKETNKRYNNWGHSSRDLGIKEALGEYIVHFNPDNILYKSALQSIYSKSVDTLLYQETNEIIIFPIKMIGMQSNGKILWREKNKEVSIIFTGFPSIKNNIDCMQLVMKRGCWAEQGGWVDKGEQSDGDTYQRFVQIYGARYCSEVLGEHR